MTVRSIPGSTHDYMFFSLFLQTLRGLMGSDVSSDEDALSDLSDPVKDDVILHELFYTKHVSL